MSKNMRMIAAACLLGAVLAAPSVAAEAIQVRDVVVAVVNKDVITRKDVLARATPMLTALDQRLPPADRERIERDIIRSALRSLVDDKLLVAEAQRLVEANETFKKRLDERVAMRIEEERRTSGGEVALRDKVKARGQTWPQHVEDIRHDIMREVVVYQFVTRDLTVAPTDVIESYRKNIATYQSPTRVKYRQVLFRSDKRGGRDNARAHAAEAAAQLDQGADFTELAREQSDDLLSRDVILFKTLGKGAKSPLDEPLQTMETGTVKGPIEVENGYALIKLEERTAGRAVAFEEAQTQIESRLLTDKRAARYDALMKRLESEHYVELVE